MDNEVFMNKHLGSEFIPEYYLDTNSLPVMKRPNVGFEVGQIYYSKKLDFLFLVIDTDNDRATFEYDKEIYPSNWLDGLVYIGEL